MGDPFNMSITHREVRTVIVPRRGVVHAIRLWEVVLWLLTENKRDRWRRHPVAAESHFGTALFVQARTERIREIGIHLRGIYGLIGHAGTNPYAVQAR